ncbi:MAG: arginase family protein, partial [Pantoea sp.]|nr:arginase family protein [Pantoea sp.]
MVCRVICSQGRIGDKSDSTLRGAKATAKLLEDRFNIHATIVGNPSPGKDDKWTECLHEAAETLEHLRSEVERSLEEQGTTILALNTC